MRLMGRGARLALALWLCSLPCCAQDADGTLEQSESEKLLLDRLMAAESGGRQFAKNPRSSALGPYQFVQGTFLDIMHRKLPELTAGKSAAEISRLRTDPKVSRHAALIYLRESAEFFSARNVPVTSANLRLAYFVGQTGALRVLAAKSDQPLASILSASVIAANPPLAALTAGELIEKSRQEADGNGIEAASPPPVALTAGPLIEKSRQEADGNGIEAASPPPVALTASPPIGKPAQETNAARTIAASLEPDASAEGSAAGRPSREAADLEAVARSSEQPLAGPNIEVRCNLKLPSCRKWLALAEMRSQKAQARLSAASRQ